MAVQASKLLQAAASGSLGRPLLVLEFGLEGRHWLGLGSKGEAQIDDGAGADARVGLRSQVGAVQLAADALTGKSSFVCVALTERMNAHSEAQRYEEAAYLRDRIQTFETVLRRQKQAEKLCGQGKFTVSFDNIVYEVDNGVLASTLQSYRRCAG